MKTILRGTAATLGLVLAAGSAQAADDARYLVVLKNGAKLDAAVADIEKAGGTVAMTLPQVGVLVATGDAGALAGVKGVQDVGLEPLAVLPQTIEVAADLEGADAAGPEADGPTADDFLLNAGLTWGVERVRAPAAWAAGETGEGVTVAVIDSGVAWNHPDLAGRVTYATCVSGDGTPCNPYPTSSNHGTHVAGTVAASFGGGLAVGVAPKASIASYNVFPAGGGGSFGAIWEAMIDAADRGYEVINMSLGAQTQRGGKGTNDLNALINAQKRVANYVRKQGTVVVASAGNDGLNQNGTPYHLPGDTPSVINVSATCLLPVPVYSEDSVDASSSFTNTGAVVDVSAPGGDVDCGGDRTTDLLNVGGIVRQQWIFDMVLSTGVVLDPTCSAARSCPTNYTWLQGTSMASPHVAGVAALVAAAEPGIKASRVKSVIKQTADNVSGRHEFGHGVVDAAAAVGAE
jgi:subtilisin family serine protease